MMKNEKCLLINSLINFRSNVKTVVWRSVTFCDPLLSDAVGCIASILSEFSWGSCIEVRLDFRVRPDMRYASEAARELHEASWSYQNPPQLCSVEHCWHEEYGKQSQTGNTCRLQNSLTTTKCKKKRFYCLSPGNWNGLSTNCANQGTERGPHHDSRYPAHRPFEKLPHPDGSSWTNGSTTVPQLFHRRQKTGKMGKSFWRRPLETGPASQWDLSWSV